MNKRLKTLRVSYIEILTINAAVTEPDEGVFALFVRWHHVTYLWIASTILTTYTREKIAKLF